MARCQLHELAPEAQAVGFDQQQATARHPDHFFCHQIGVGDVVQYVEGDCRVARVIGEGDALCVGGAGGQALLVEPTRAFAEELGDPVSTDAGWGEVADLQRHLAIACADFEQAQALAFAEGVHKKLHVARDGVLRGQVAQ